MHFKDDPIRDMHAKNYVFMSYVSAWALKIWSRLLIPSFPARSRRIQLPGFLKLPANYWRTIIENTTTDFPENFY